VGDHRDEDLIAITAHCHARCMTLLPGQGFPARVVGDDVSEGQGKSMTHEETI
jgi:hypothetical protein